MISTSDGLSDADAARRLAEEGPNDLPVARPKSNLAVVRDVLREPMFLLLLATGVVYLTTLIPGNLALIWTDRSSSRKLTVLLRARNSPLWILTGSALLLLTLVLYVPGIREVLEFSTLHGIDIAACLGLTVLSIAWFELVKRTSVRVAVYDIVKENHA